jgi:hypothetical protein
MYKNVEVLAIFIKSSRGGAATAGFVRSKSVRFPRIIVNLEVFRANYVFLKRFSHEILGEFFNSKFRKNADPYKRKSAKSNEAQIKSKILAAAYTGKIASLNMLLISIRRTIVFWHNLLII